MKQICYISFFSGLLLASSSMAATKKVDDFASAPSCKHFLDRVSTTTLQYVEDMASPFEFRIDSKSNQTLIPTANAWFSGDSSSHQVRPEFSELVQHHMQVTPEERAKIDEIMTAYHAGLGMTFRKKSEDGAYDQEFQVAVNSAVMPIPGEQFDKMVSAAGPVLRKLRAIIQDLGAGKLKSPEDLGLDQLSLEDQQAIFERMTESPYLIQQLVHSNISEYPALSISGVDAALGKVYESIYELFEINTGTPSGLSNLSLLLESLRINDPDQFRKVYDHLGEDQTFQLLKRTVEDSAKYWTGREDGLSVIISPGPGNGAYPDVASISILSGMPLVRLSDMYVDTHGDLRMLVNSQLVTGIYSRAEESFLFNNPDAGIGMLAPDNERINEKINLNLKAGEQPLEPFVSYVYRYEGSEVVDVFRDEEGRPIISAYWDQLSADPSTGDKGSLAEAFVNRKVFVSNAFGRVADDKFVFQKVAEQLTLQGISPLTGPPPSLASDNYDAFFNNPDLYVPKVTDESGGSGVYLMISLPDEKKQQVIEMVRAHPEDYVIQQRIEPLLMVGAETNANGSYSMGTRMAGWRIFVFLDTDGNVRTSDRSVLVRTASVGSLSENTSQGGGYGIGIPWRNTQGSAPRTGGSRDRPLAQSILPTPSRRAVLTHSQISSIRSFNSALANLMVDHSVKGEKAEAKTRLILSDLKYLMRELMPVFGFNFTQSEYQLALLLEKRKLPQAQVTRFLTELIKLIDSKLSESQRGQLQVFPVAKVESYLQLPGFGEGHVKDLPKGGLQTDVDPRALGQILEIRESLVSLVPYSRVDWTYESDSGQETGRYELVRDQSALDQYPSLVRFNLILSMVEEAGGVMVMNEYTDEEALDGKKSKVPSAYFRVDANGRPVLAFNIFAPNAMAALEHEAVHFQSWLELYRTFKSRGLGHKEASEKATEAIFEPQFVFNDEKKAVNSEMKSQISGGVLNFDKTNTTLLELGTIRKLIYPYLASINKAFRQEDAEFAQSMADRMISELIWRKKSVREQIQEQITKTSQRRKRLRLQSELVSLQNQPLIHLALGQSDRDRFESIGALGAFYQIFLDALQNYEGDELTPRDKAIEAAAIGSIGSFYLNSNLEQQQ